MTKTNATTSANTRTTAPAALGALRPPALSDLSLTLDADLELVPRGIARHVEGFFADVIQHCFDEESESPHKRVVGELRFSTFALLEAELAGISLVRETDLEGGIEFDFAQRFLSDGEPAPHVAGCFQQPLHNVVLVHQVALDDDLVDAFGKALAPLLVAEVLQRAFPDHDAYFLAPPHDGDDPDEHRSHRETYAAIGAFGLDDGYLGIDPALVWLGEGRSRLRQELGA